MLNIFNKKKVKELERELKIVREELERERGAKIELKRELQILKSSSLDNLIGENQKLIEWIQKILEVAQICKTNEGLQMVNIPIKEEIKCGYDSNWELSSEQRKEIIIPSIRYIKM